MKASDVEIVIDKKELGQLTEKMKNALVLTMGELQNRIREEQVIPRDTGALQGEKFFVDSTGKNQGVVQLVNEGPYARRSYYHPEYNFRQDKNKNAQGMWFTMWQKGGYYEKEPQEIFEKIMKTL